ncbi:MAG: BrnT family toxin [Acidobacteria bacterium]|nr:BrnT family toxin [Acidobacteriota bacterium]
MVFAWDPSKATANVKKHGVDFREAATVFDDPLSTTFPDGAHSKTERRFLTIGLSANRQVLVVAHSGDDETIRIISARPVTRRERNFYEEDQRESE